MACHYIKGTADDSAGLPQVIRHRTTIPLTPHAKMILGLAQPAAHDGGKISPRHLMPGIIAESRDWRRRGLDGPHHLEKAATAAGTSLTQIEPAPLRPITDSNPRRTPVIGHRPATACHPTCQGSKPGGHDHGSVSPGHGTPTGNTTFTLVDRGSGP